MSHRSNYLYCNAGFEENGYTYLQSTRRAIFRKKMILTGYLYQRQLLLLDAEY